MAQSPDRRRRLRTRLGAICGTLWLLAGGAYYLYLGGYAVARDVALHGRRPVAEATVVSQHRSKSAVTDIDVVYTTGGGRRVRATVDEFRDPAPIAGGIITVRYDPSHPGWFVRDARCGATVWKALMFLSVGLLLTLCAVVVARSA